MSATTTVPSPPAVQDAPGGWIVCLGDERSVTQGLVACPLRGSVELAVCLDCHLLETMAAERRRDGDCQVGEAETISAGAW